MNSFGKGMGGFKGSSKGAGTGIGIYGVGLGPSTGGQAIPAPPDPTLKPKQLTVSNENTPPPKKINFQDNQNTFGSSNILTTSIIIISIIFGLIVLLIFIRMFFK